MISAAPYVNEITFAAHTESERKEIGLWKSREQGAHDWSLHFKDIVYKVEHIAGDDVWREREELLCKRISKLRGTDTPEYLKSVFITPDLTPKERDTNKALRSKLSELNKDGKVFRIKNGKIVRRET